VISGEGGALLVNNPELEVRAEIIREKGTDRSRFFRGEVDKYTWQEVGSSYLPGELISAFLWAQLEQAEGITAARISAWNYYHEKLVDLENLALIRRPVVPLDCKHNAHMYYILLNPEIDRQQLLNSLKASGIYSVFHYIPLHSSPAGKLYGRSHGSLDVTNSLSERIVRLPIWVGLTNTQQDLIVGILYKILKNKT
jgi:dTDP-4-amino-4,6-dideoxygalactose transaminase